MATEDKRGMKEEIDLEDEGGGTGLRRLALIAISTPMAALAFWFCMAQIADAVRDAPTSQVNPEHFIAASA
nr:hypothetical protein [Variovorax boronicumulans]